METKDIVKAIKEKIDIVDYIGRFLSLQKEGSSYKALCPFHPDKNPSFSIKPSEQFFHCFGCGVSGDVIDFAMKYHNLDFKEAVQMLAKEIGLPVGDNKQNEENTQTKKLSIEEIIAYVETCQKQVNLTNYFTDREIPASLISKYGAGFDVENNAVVFPIVQDGQIVSYTRRNLEGKPKYENPEGYNTMPFNIDILKDEQQEKVFIVEGIFDALTIEAALGQPAIALNSDTNQNNFLRELNRIKPKNKKFYILFDNDVSGINEARKLFDKMKSDYEVAICRWDGDIPYKDINEFWVANPEECTKFLKWQLKTAFYPYALISIVPSYEEFIKSEKFAAISTGFKQLDDVLNGGLVAGNLYVFGAKPSVGKTTFLLQLMDNFLRQGYDCVFLSAEMPKEEIMTRIFCREYGLKKANVQIPAFDFYRKLRTRTASNEEMQEYMNVVKDYTKKYAFKLHIVEEQRLVDVPYILDRLQKPILFIDYLQLLQPAGQYQSDKQRVDLIMQELVEIKNRFLIPVVVISSLNRENYDKDDMTAFKESGSIEYGTAAAFLMQRDNDRVVHDDYKGNGYTIHFKCVKNRYGSIGEDVTMRFWGGIYLFEEVENNERKPSFDK